MHINTVLFALNQLGVGPESGFIISSASETWTDFIGDRKDIEGVKSYIYLKVKLMFDPPSNSYLVDTMDRQIKELECRLNIQVDKPTVEGGTVSGQ